MEPISSFAGRAWTLPADDLRQPPAEAPAADVEPSAAPIPPCPDIEPAARRWRAQPAAAGPRAGAAPAGKVARLHLVGPMRLLDAEERDRTPRSGILQTLLAILALSPNGVRTRVKLQDLLWGDADQEHGSQSLRTALSRLRRELAVLSADLLETDNLTVRLRVADLWIDVFEYSAGRDRRALHDSYGAELPDLLEGLNVRSTNCEDLEDWLREERRFWGERLEALLEAEEPPAPARPPPLAAMPGRAALGPPAPDAATFGVGLLPAVICTASQQAAFIADAFLDSMASALRDFMLAEVYDYRDTGGAFPLPSDGAGPPILLRAKVLEEAGRLMLTLLAYRCGPGRLLWSWSVEVPDGGARAQSVLVFVNEAVDRVCATLAGTGAGEASTPYHALNTMFRLDGTSLDAAHTLLERGYAESGDSVHLSLLAYLNSFRVGEHWLTYDERVRDETRDLVDAVLAGNPFNSLTLAMTGHACGYILHEHEAAVDLLERATRLDPSPAICWDHLALNYLYVGRIEDALRASEMAIRLGSFSPFRFTYDTTMCMVSTIRGDYAKAVRYGERALSRRPTFGAALRYTAVSLGHLGERAAAGSLIARIRAMAPDFSSDWVANDRLAVADGQAKARLLIGLQKAGA